MTSGASGARGERAGGAAPSHNEASVFGRGAPPGDWPEGRPPRLTLDTSALNARGSIPAMNRVERWAEEGKVVLYVPPEVTAEAEAHLGGKGRAMYAGKARSLHGGGEAAGAPAGLEEEMAAVLFPHTRPGELTPGQRRDARILALHRSLGNDVFLTLDTRHFIQKGRRERLAARGVRAMTPAEFAAWAMSRLG